MNKRAIIIVVILIIVFLTLQVSTRNNAKVVVIRVNSDIDAGTERHIGRGLNFAKQIGAEVVIIELNTPGGYLDPLRRIIDYISSAKVRVVAWVPPGGIAASAGAFIAITCDKLYMSPGSAIGSAEPRPPDPKVVNFTAAWIAGLAEKKWGRGDQRVTIVREFVTLNKALTAEEAYEVGVADGIASNLGEVLEKEGLQGASIVVIERNVIDDLVALVSEPLVIGLMLLMGIILIIAELAATGFQGWGIGGLIIIVLSLYGAGIVGLDLLALTLFIAGSMLLAVEIVKAGFQGFGLIGVVIILLASYLAYTSQPYKSLGINTILLIPPLLITTSILAYIAFKAAQAARMKTKSLREELIGARGYAKTKIVRGRRGVVYVSGEEWTAISDEDIEEGEEIEVKNIEGLILVVKKVK